MNNKTGLRWLWLAVLAFVLTRRASSPWSSCCRLAIRGGDHPFNLVHVYNKQGRPSASWRIRGWQRWFFALLAFAICGLLIHWLRKQSVTQRWSGIAYSLIIGGALGNVFDRLVLGHVVDFLDFWQRAHWPAFNLADSFIFIGAAMIVLDGFRGEKTGRDLMSQSIAADSSVLFHFSIKLEDGSVADSTALHGKPARLRMGDGSLTPSFEQCLLGLREGRARASPWRRKRRSASNPDNIYHLDRAKFGADVEPKVGTIITVRPAQRQSELPGIIRAVEGMSVTVDFNHPRPVTPSPSRWRSWG